MIVDAAIDVQVPKMGDAIRSTVTPGAGLHNINICPFRLADGLGLLPLYITLPTLAICFIYAHFESYKVAVCNIRNMCFPVR